MKRTLTNPVFLTCLLLASINQVLEKAFGIFVPLIHSYLDDFLCFPIVLTLGLAAYRLRWPDYQLSVWHTIPVFLIFSFYFEVYLPKTSANYTSDFVDVLMYLCGLAIFGYFINKKDTVGLESN
ncbi:MAG: hypothetical protein K9G46_14240 [Flavobacteriales bacterium]|jgi:hypothetical protein|nr:hypothetical protein [Flavobacteriales bacterium]